MEISIKEGNYLIAKNVLDTNVFGQNICTHCKREFSENFFTDMHNVCPYCADEAYLAFQGG